MFPVSSFSFEKTAPSPPRKHSRQEPIPLRKQVDILRATADRFSDNGHLLCLKEKLYWIYRWGQTYREEAYLLVDLKGNKQILKIPKDAGSNAGTLSAIAAKLECYYRLKSAGFPIATHYNLDPLCTELPPYCQIKDSAERHEKIKNFVEEHFKDGFYLVQYVPYSLPKLRSERELPIYERLRFLFQTLFRLGIAADFNRPNVGLLKEDDPNSLRYCNSFPIVEDPMAEETGSFSVMLPGLLRSFAPEGSLLESYLDPRISSSSSQSDKRQKSR